MYHKYIKSHVCKYTYIHMGCTVGILGSAWSACLLETVAYVHILRVVRTIETQLYGAFTGHFNKTVK